MIAVLEPSGIRTQFNLDTLQRQMHDKQASGLLIFVLAFAQGNMAQIPGWVFGVKIRSDLIGTLRGPPLPTTL